MYKRIGITTNYEYKITEFMQENNFGIFEIKSLFFIKIY